MKIRTLLAGIFITMISFTLSLSAEPIKPVFAVDFESGFDGKALVAGNEQAVPAGRNGGVELVEGKTGKAAYIHFTAEPGDVLYYRAGNVLNPFLGTLDCWVKVGGWTDTGRQHIVVDLRNRAQTGYLLAVSGNGNLSFSSQKEGKVLTEAAVPARNLLGDGQWHRIRAVWQTMGLRLYVDGTKKAGNEEAIIPAVLGQEIFIGSGYEGTNQLDGAIDDVQIYGACLDF